MKGPALLALFPEIPVQRAFALVDVSPAPLSDARRFILGCSSASTVSSLFSQTRFSSVSGDRSPHLGEAWLVGRSRARPARQQEGAALPARCPARSRPVRPRPARRLGGRLGGTPLMAHSPSISASRSSPFPQLSAHGSATSRSPRMRSSSARRAGSSVASMFTTL